MSTPTPPRTPVLLGSLTGGFAASVAMWSVWLSVHTVTMATQGTTGPYAVLGACCMATLLLVAAWAGRVAGPGAPVRIGLGAGLVAGVLAMLLLGSKIVEQPETTEQMTEAANRFRSDAPLVVLGFLLLCTVVGAIGGMIGGLMAPRDRGAPAADRWLAWFGVVGALSMLPLIGLGGAVTSTESGMAVPDGVTSYGAFSALFPISLMSEPRIFMEHSHRLFGSLVGLTTLVLWIGTVARTPGRARWSTLGATLAFVVFAAGAMGMSHAGVLPTPAAIAIMAVIGIGTLGFTHAMVARGVAPGAAGGLFALVTIQGLYGIVRVDENLAWVAMFHGVFAQVVFATGAMVAAVLFDRAALDGPLDEATATSARGIRKLALVALILTTVQIIFGALARHITTSAGEPSSHSIYTHAGFSFVVVVVVVLAASVCARAGAGDRHGRAIRWMGRAVFVVLFFQFLLGWMALWVVMTGEQPAAIPLADELESAHAIRPGEALVTTLHQTGGALLLAALALVLFWARRAARIAR